MKWWLLIAVASLTGAGCGTTTTAGPVADDGAPRWFAENASPDANGETTDQGPEQPSVVVQSTSPTDVRVRTEHEDVVALLRPPGRRTAVNHRARALEGILLGVGMGALTGALLGSAGGPSDSGARCDSCLGGAAIFGVLGLVVGSAVVAAIDRGNSHKPTW